MHVRYPPKEFNKNQFEEFVSRVLEISSLDLDSFGLCCADIYDMSTVGRWIDAAIRRNVKLLHLRFSVVNKYHDDIELPHSLVTCGSLEVLKLSLYDCRLSLPKFTGFSVLRVLRLSSCKLLNYDLVHNFLKSLTLLEDLSLIDCEPYDFNIFSISCPKLRNLRIDNRNLQGSFPMWDELEGLCNYLKICCPKLVFLEFAFFMASEIKCESLDSLKKAVIHPQDMFEWSGKGVCDLFAGISHVESLSLRISLTEEDINLQNLPKSLPNLKTLELTTRISTNNVDVLIQILTCSVNLESLHVIIEDGSLYSLYLDEDPDFDFLEEMKCTFEQLKMVRVTGLSAFTDDIDFIKFLLKSTPYLETMSITPCGNMANLSFMTSVSTFQRASPEAKIIFV